MEFSIFQFVPAASCLFVRYHWEESGILHLYSLP